MREEFTMLRVVRVVETILVLRVRPEVGLLKIKVQTATWPPLNLN
jgi:hypothetical protein